MRVLRERSGIEAVRASVLGTTASRPEPSAEEPWPERPMRRVGHRPYGRTMRDHRHLAIVRHPSVTIEAAAELTDVDVPTVRGWAREGTLVIEQRGDMEVVKLDDVKALAARRRATKRGGLHDRLADSSTTPAAEVVNIADLHRLARERSE